MAERFTYRLTLATGRTTTVLVDARRDHVGRPLYSIFADGDELQGPEPLALVAEHAGRSGLAVVEILAPGVLSRDELRAEAWRASAEVMRSACVDAYLRAVRDSESAVAAMHSIPLPEVPRG